MKPLLQSLSGIISPGMSLAKPEVIRRYRQIKDANKKVMIWLSMLQFSQLVRNEEGELYLV
jgi:hypothetical protein